MPHNPRDEALPLPLAGIRVLEFTHTVMGPCAGLMLADLGAEVIKIEPAPEGDRTRRLGGFGAGFYDYFNRNKRSLAVDLKTDRGQRLIHRVAMRADVVIENFAPGAMARLGCDYDMLSTLNPRLIYCALKGFLSGPYENRPALDEVAQFMSGLAYMTGPRGAPLRAGTSVVDIMGGTFGVVGILAALHSRAVTGKGCQVKSALFESAVFMMGQHMAGEAITGENTPPMPERRSVWGIYQTFATADNDQVFLGVTSDRQWLRFCEQFGRRDLLADARLKTNEGRVQARSWLIAEIAALVRRFTRAEILAMAEAAEIPFARVARVGDLFDDPQLNAGGLVEVELSSGLCAKLPRLPLELDGRTLGLRREAPAVGEDSAAILAEIGMTAAEIHSLATDGIILARERGEG